MGCGSLSTAAVQTGHGASRPDMAPSYVSRTDRSNTLSVRSSSNTKSSLRKKESGAPTFKVTIKEIDEEKHKDDHGGVWLGSENCLNDVTPDLTPACDLQPSLNEDKNIVGFIKNSEISNNARNVPDRESAQYATISYDSTASLSALKQNEISESRVPESQELGACVSKHSPKQRHLQDSLVHFRSVEDGFSYNYEHCDVDKQMSDSELDDHIPHFVSERTSETAQQLTESKEGIVGNTDVNPDVEVIRPSLSQSGHVGDSSSATLSSDLGEVGSQTQSMICLLPVVKKTLPISTQNLLSNFCPTY